MLPEDRLDEAAKQAQIVHDEADLSDQDKAALRNARKKLDRVRHVLAVNREQREDAEVVD